MQRLCMQKLAFDTDIQPWEVPGFYAALRRLSGMTAAPKNYPLLQCKTRWQDGRLQPLVVALGERQPDWQTMLAQPNQMIQLHERCMPLRVAHAATVTFELRQTDRMRSYRLYNFQPFDREHYLQYRHLQEDVERLQLIEQCLSRHLIHFAQGVDWRLNIPVAVAELKIFKTNKKVLMPLSFLKV